MPWERKLPADAELLRMAQTLSNADIARTFDTTSRAVSKAIRTARARLVDGPAGEDGRRKYARFWPWRVEKREHYATYFYDMLRLWTRAHCDVGEPLSPAEQSMLDRFEAEVERLNLVMFYDPDTPSGFAFRTRRRADGDLFLVER